jgi:hypothetical protein
MKILKYKAIKALLIDEISHVKFCGLQNIKTISKMEVRNSIISLGSLTFTSFGLS